MKYISFCLVLFLSACHSIPLLLEEAEIVAEDVIKEEEKIQEFKEINAQSDHEKSRSSAGEGCKALLESGESCDRHEEASRAN